MTHEYAPQTTSSDLHHLQAHLLFCLSSAIVQGQLESQFVPEASRQTNAWLTATMACRLQRRMRMHKEVMPTRFSRSRLWYLPIQLLDIFSDLIDPYTRPVLNSDFATPLTTLGKHIFSGNRQPAASVVVLPSRQSTLHAKLVWLGQGYPK